MHFRHVFILLLFAASSSNFSITPSFMHYFSIKTNCSTLAPIPFSSKLPTFEQARAQLTAAFPEHGIDISSGKFLAAAARFLSAKHPVSQVVSDGKLILCMTSSSVSKARLIQIFDSELMQSHTFEQAAQQEFRLDAKTSRYNDEQEFRGALNQQLSLMGSTTEMPLPLTSEGAFPADYINPVVMTLDELARKIDSLTTESHNYLSRFYASAYERGETAEQIALTSEALKTALPESIKAKAEVLLQTMQTKSIGWKRQDGAYVINDARRLKDFLLKAGLKENEAEQTIQRLQAASPFRWLSKTRLFGDDQQTTASESEAGYFINSYLQKWMAARRTLSQSRGLTPDTLASFMKRQAELLAELNKYKSFADPVSGTRNPYFKELWETIMLEVSKYSRDISVMIIKAVDENTPEAKDFIELFLNLSSAGGPSFGDQLAQQKDLARTQYQTGLASCFERYYKAEFLKGKAKDAAKGINKAVSNITDWLNPANNIPAYHRAGILRAILEGDGEALVFGFPSWRTFGTAGIRNPAVYSSNPLIQKLYVTEFYLTPQKPEYDSTRMEQLPLGPHAAIPTGPNFMNPMTFLQQQRTIVQVMNMLQATVRQAEAQGTDLSKPVALIDENGAPVTTAKGEPVKIQIDPEFLQNIKQRKIVIAYDSRLNGAYYAHMLAAAFLKDGINVSLFDNPSGVPPVALKAGLDGFPFGILISASHSECTFNGFKFFIGHHRSQVDEPSQKVIMAIRENPKYVNYGNIDLHGLAVKTFEDFNEVFREHADMLTWLGKKDPVPGRDYCGARREDFYTEYFDLVKRRSPVYQLITGLNDKADKLEAGNKRDEADALRAQAVELHARIQRERDNILVLQTAFFGAGTTDAANFAHFLAESGYPLVDKVRAQTDVMDGRFPGFFMPDPGVPSGFVLNMLDYLVQVAGPDFTLLERAISALNAKDVGTGEDPDIDRAGIAFSLPEGVEGNIKAPLLDMVEKYCAYKRFSPDKTARVIALVRSTLNDKYLMTANEAWSFMAAQKLSMLEENDLLEKDKLYVIIKSHVTTPHLERIARTYQKKGYNTAVVDTYVGFTELAFKSRELFKLAKDAYTASGAPAGLKLAALQWAQEYEKYRANIIPVIGAEDIEPNSLELLAGKIIEYALSSEDPDGQLSSDAMKALEILSRIEIICGVEESNGYGEFGRAENGRVMDKHISEKDGGLAAFEYLELIAYGRTKGKSPYNLFEGFADAFGLVYTTNMALSHPGASGEGDKLNEVEGIEKHLAYYLARELDAKKAAGHEMLLMDGAYSLEDVWIYRAGKYDSKGTYLGFPEEGVRLVLRVKATGDLAIVTFRPSGTGDTNRVYSWIMKEKRAPGTPFTQYWKELRETGDALVRDMYGIEVELGRMLVIPCMDKNTVTNANAWGLLAALKGTGVDHQEAAFSVFCGGRDSTPEQLALNDIERAMIAHAKLFSNNKLPSNERPSAADNKKIWVAYLAYVQEHPELFPAESLVGAYGIKVPKAALLAWAYPFMEYLRAEGKIGPNADYLTELKKILNGVRGNISAAEDVSRKLKEELSAVAAQKMNTAGVNIPFFGTIRTIIGERPIEGFSVRTDKDIHDNGALRNLQYGTAVTPGSYADEPWYYMINLGQVKGAPQGVEHHLTAMKSSAYTTGHQNPAGKWELHEVLEGDGASLTWDMDKDGVISNVQIVFLKKGDQFLIAPGQWHATFAFTNGLLFADISTPQTGGPATYKQPTYFGPPLLITHVTERREQRVVTNTAYAAQALNWRVTYPGGYRAAGTMPFSALLQSPETLMELFAREKAETALRCAA